MVAPRPELREKIKNTRNLVKRNQAHLVPGLAKDRPDLYLDLDKYEHFDRIRPWAEKSAPKRVKHINIKTLQPQVYDKILILCADFPDRPAQTPVSTIWERFFSTTFNQGYTFVNYYTENSFSHFVPQGEVHGWYRAPKTASYYVGSDNGLTRSPELVNDILNIASIDPDINWASFDSDGDNHLDYLIIVHAGDEAASSGSLSDFWAHVWNMTPVVIQGKRLDIYALVSEYVVDYFLIKKQVSGIDCHEFGHLLRIPDLYDYGGDSMGAGNFSLMSHGSWANGGLTPVHFDIWSKFKLGWINPTVDKTGIVTMRNIENYPDAVLYTTQNSMEYFMLENRQQMYFDYYLPSSGLLIWHINENIAGNDNQACYQVGLVQADGLKQLEMNINAGDNGDPYPGIAGNRSFGQFTDPAPTLCSGAVANMSITNISDSAQTISFMASTCPALSSQISMV